MYLWQNERPEICLITNHGYAGANLPTGGAPDTGGQNFYVNMFALMLERLGYAVTIFSRGGFLHYKRSYIRQGTEFLSDFVRYVFVPGGGKEFLRKEDISIALDEEVEWIYEFLTQCAKKQECEPWQIYKFINTHYWDAGVIAVRLIEKWKHDILARIFYRELNKIVDKETLYNFYQERHWRVVANWPEYHLGYLLMNNKKITDSNLNEKIKEVISHWNNKILNKEYIYNNIKNEISKIRNKDPMLMELEKYSIIGRQLILNYPDLKKEYEREFNYIDKHVWTPHSLGELKDYNYRNQSVEVRRGLKFCERRSHESLIANNTQHFVATSANIAKYLGTHYNVSMEKIFYFPPCVDRRKFRIYKEEELERSYKYLSDISGISVSRLKTSKIIFETSRMDYTKRKDLLLSAFAEIGHEYDDVFLFIGGGPKNEIYYDLENQIKNDEFLHKHAFLTGSIPEEFIGPLFSLADIYATASEMEGFGMCVIQAAASGTPIVSSNLIPFSINYVSDIAEIFNAGDIKEFANSLRNLLDNKGKQKDKAQYLQERTKRFDWENKTKQFITYLNNKVIELDIKEN